MFRALRLKWFTRNISYLARLMRLIRSGLNILFQALVAYYHGKRRGGINVPAFTLVQKFDTFLKSYTPHPSLSSHYDEISTDRRSGSLVDCTSVPPILVHKSARTLVERRDFARIVLVKRVD